MAAIACHQYEMVFNSSRSYQQIWVANDLASVPKIAAKPCKPSHYQLRQRHDFDKPEKVTDTAAQRLEGRCCHKCHQKSHRR